MSNKYGLIGFPIGHSFSKKYFTKKFLSQSIDAHYELFPLSNINQLPSLIEKYPDLLGLNVTIPYKQQVIKYLDEITDEAEKINAVNTIKVTRSDNLIQLAGSNTDAPAFEAELLNFTGDKTGKALILGTGGAAASVAFVLGKLNWSYHFVSRRPSNSSQFGYKDLNAEIIQSTLLIVNTTPLGMFPDVEKYPDFPYQHLNKNHYLFDLVYNPPQATFLNKGHELGAKTRNGMGMLVRQAELAWETWQK